MKKIMILVLASLLLVGCQNEKTPFDKYKGTYTETTYTNKELGFVFTVPEGATMHSEQEIKDSDAARLEGKSEEEQAKLKNSKKLLHATFAEQGVSVYAYLEYYENGKDVDTYLDEMKLYYSNVDSFVPEFGEVYPAKLYDRDFQVLPFTMQYMDNVTMIYATQIDNYILSLVFTYPKTDAAMITSLIRAFDKQ